MGHKNKREKALKFPAQQQPPQPTPTQQLMARFGVSLQQFSGPLPPPEILEKYNAVEPGFANRIMAMAEEQSRHRQNMERMVIDRRTRHEGRAQVLAFVLALAIGGGAVWLISIGKSLEGLGTIVAELTAFAGVFIYGKRRQQQELDEKKQALARQN